MKLKRLVILVASIVCLFGTTSAQQPQTRPAATGLALEVTYFEGRPPAYQPVLGVNMPRRGSWYALFGRVADWQLPAGAQPIDAVRLVPYLEGDRVRITVSVLRGEKFQDSEDSVASYVLRENERLTLVALQDFGVVPFKIKVIRLAPQTSEFPAIVNNTKSLEVVGIEPVVSTFAVYKLTLHNLSDRNISALQVNTVRDGKIKLSGMPQGAEGEALIKSGDYFALKQPMSTAPQPTPGGYAPESLPAQQIVIVSLMFEDGTYEGEAKPAATYRGFALGRKTELERVVPVLENALAESVSPADLRTRLSTLSVEVEESDLANLVAAFPDIKRERLQSPLEVSMHGIRRELLDELKQFDQSQRSPGDFQLWLIGTRDRYSKWLARVSSQR